MAKIRKPGPQRKYTAAAFEKAVEEYFLSISYQEPVTRRVPVLDEAGKEILDKYGHVIWKHETIETADGKPAMVTKWTEPPELTNLFLYLGIDKATFSRYGHLTEEDDPNWERFCNTVSRARGRVEAYNALKIHEPKGFRGAQFTLQNNFDWKEKKEVSLDEETRKAVSAKSMTMEEKLAILREAETDCHGLDDASQ